LSKVGVPSGEPSEPKIKFKPSKVPLKDRVTLIKLRLKTVTMPVKKKALKAQLKACKKVIALRKALKNADPERKSVIKAKLVKATRVLRKASIRVK